MPKQRADASARIAEAVHVARVALASCPDSTLGYSQLLQLAADNFEVSGFETLAMRLVGGGRRSGPKGIDDSAPLRQVAEMEALGAGVSAVGIVAKTMAPGDPAAQETIARRLRAKKKNGAIK